MKKKPLKTKSYSVKWGTTVDATSPHAAAVAARLLQGASELHVKELKFIVTGGGISQQIDLSLTDPIDEKAIRFCPRCGEWGNLHATAQKTVTHTEVEINVLPDSKEFDGHNSAGTFVDDYKLRNIWCDKCKTNYKSIKEFVRAYQEWKSR